MSDQPTGGGELSHFEQLSAITPRKQPLAIVIGALVVGVALILINKLAPTETVDQLKKEEAKKAAAAAVQPAEASGPAGDIDDI